MNLKQMALFLSLVAVLFFQNCSSNVGFDSQKASIANPSGTNTESATNTQDSNNNSANSNSSSGGNTVSATPMATDNTPPPASGITVNVSNGNQDQPATAPTVSITDTVVKKEDVHFEKCQSFQELNLSGDLINLPEKSSENICYYIKLFNAVANHKSGTYGEKRDPDVLSSNHNGDSSTYIAPFVMGDASVKFNNQANWKISLSGAYNDPKVQMAIDNYFFVQFTYGSPAIELNSAFGTADAEPGKGALPILYKDLELNFEAFAAGGTAMVDAIGLQTPSSTDANFDFIYNLRLRALDCGGSAQLKDVYLVFYDDQTQSTTP